MKSVLDSDDRLDAARSLYWHAVMNRPNKLVILCKRARVLARSDHPETMPIQVEPGIPTFLSPAAIILKQCRSKLSQVFRPFSKYVLNQSLIFPCGLGPGFVAYEVGFMRMLLALRSRDPDAMLRLILSSTLFR